MQLIGRVLPPLILVALAPVVLAQYEPPVDHATIAATTAYTWTADNTIVAQLEGPVTIELGKNILKSKQAVIWVRQLAGENADQQRCEVALLGEASLEQPNGVKRSGPRLYINSVVRDRKSVV